MSAKDIRDAIERFQDAVAREAHMSASGIATDEIYGMDYWRAVDEKNAAKMDLGRAIAHEILADRKLIAAKTRGRTACLHVEVARTPEGGLICVDCGADAPSRCDCASRFPDKMFPVDRYNDGHVYCSHCRRRWYGSGRSRMETRVCKDCHLQKPVDQFPETMISCRACLVEGGS